VTATRFAPSPTGLLHLGHAFSAILNHDLASARGGRFHLRIEDIDRTRCRPEFEAAIVEDLAWLGLEWDPLVLRQSDRMAVYAQKLEALAERGLVYRCFRSRAEVQEALSAPHGPKGIFTAEPLPAEEEARLMEEGQPFAVRLSLAAAKKALGPRFSSLTVREETQQGLEERSAQAEGHGDIVLARKDVGTSYHLASVTDDAATGIDLVCRGEDLADAADLHVLLYALFEEEPPVYRHHKLVTDESGKRLAKRDKSATLASLREAGETPEGIRRRLGLHQ
jgi:glutamyl-Q tRNA(Asp) synthetase